MIEYSVAAETLHEMGRDGVMRIRRWLDHTARFALSHSAYDRDADGNPYTQVRVEQLSGRVENFDLVGDILDPQGAKGNTIYVECKKYSQAGDQGTLYTEYLAVAYSAFVAKYKALHHPPSIEFMWVTTHPFSQTTFAKLTAKPTIADACADERFKDRLGGEDYNDELGALLADRLWLCVVNDRMLNEMLMGPDLRAAVLAKMAALGTV